jgi:hypothetical protein
MHEQARRDHEVEGAAGEAIQNELQPLRWQAHVEEEVQRLVREHQPAPGPSHFAEEYAARAMRGVEADENGYRQAAERGERGDEKIPSYLADAGDIAGG